ncbi:MAG: hypothetical protein DMD96_24275 [Candidatus Rokuibacteriota bacterium]|nr:MAG: hypothetical protein DMD96_24275 [Candidatus Rokubacteria bacterium]
MYIHGDLGFRPVEAGDLDALKELHNEMSTLLQLGNVEMFSSEEQAQWWKSLAGSRTTRRFAIVELRENTVIGVIRVQNIDALNRNCEVGLDIVPTLRRRGYGRASYRMLLEYLFLHFNMHMVYLRVGEFNGQAKALYERLGFVEGGAFKEYLYRHGRYWDYILMCMTKEQYLKAYEAHRGARE